MLEKSSIYQMSVKDILTTLVLVAIIFLIYYMTYYGRNKEAKKIKKMQDELKEGDKIITYSGLAGIIDKIEEDRIILKTYPDNVKISIEKWAVAGLDDRTID